MPTESHPDQLQIWNEVQDHYLLSTLQATLNGIPDAEKSLTDLSEKNLMSGCQR